MSATYDADGNRGTVLNRARRFFKDNPDEMLTREDLQVKFDCGRATAKLVARALIREGVVMRSQLPRAPRKSRAQQKPFPDCLTRAQLDSRDGGLP